MTPRLLEPGKEGERVREVGIYADEFLVGRGADCNLRLQDSATSRHHCLIRVRGDEATLVDLGSSNGTYLNGVRVLSQSALHTGDEIRIGEFRYIVDLGDDPAWAERFMHHVDPVATTMRRPPNV